MQSKSSDEDCAGVLADKVAGYVQFKERRCLQERAGCLEAIYKEHINPQEVFDTLATQPDEIKLHVLEELVIARYAHVHIQSAAYLGEIVSAVLIKCRNEQTRDALRPSLEDAILGTSTIRLDITFERQTDGVFAVISESVHSLVGKIKHLELRCQIKIKSHCALYPTALLRASAGMESLRSQLKAFESFKFLLDIDCDLTTSEEGKSGAWLSWLCTIRSDNNSSGYTTKSVRELVDDVLVAIKRNGLGNRILLFQLSIENEMYRYKIKSDRWRLQSQEIEFRKLDDIFRTLDIALATVEEV